MKKLGCVGATLAGLALAGPVRGADMPIKAPVAPVAAPYDWTGAYIGGHLGWLWGAARVEENGVLTDDHALINGAIGGVVAGYNWQSGTLVLGFDGDFGFSNAHGTDVAGAVEPPNLYDIKSTYHVRGRVGVAMPNDLLWFVAGGLAAANFRFTSGEAEQQKGAYFDGGSIGAGFEYGLMRDVTGRVELIYDDFGSKTYLTGTDSYRVHLTGRTVRGALTVRFWTGQ
jgi:outer membrane immunogenic protein